MIMMINDIMQILISQSDLFFCLLLGAVKVVVLRNMMVLMWQLAQLDNFCHRSLGPCIDLSG